MEDSSKVVSEVMHTAKDILDSEPVKDLVHPATKEIGKSLGTIARMVNNLLLPIEIANWKVDQLREKLLPEVQRRVEIIPVERRVTPNIAIAGPIFESAAYSVQEDILRDLYANLLAKAMDSDTVPYVHPSFVEIIRQMTVDEARIMMLFASSHQSNYPVINLYCMSDGREWSFRFYSLIGELAGCLHCDATPRYLDNLSRLGLIEIIDFNGPLSPQNELHEEYKRRNNDHQSCILGYMRARLTNFGDNFCDVCIR
ncbi:MAG: DUF4393 domain-containing protein [Armatimonadota bacterium]